MEINGYEVFHVEPQVELGDFLAKIKNVEKEKLAFIIPPNFSWTKEELELLKLNEVRTAKELAFITNHEERGQILRQLGFKVYENLAALRKAKELVEKELLIEDLPRKKSFFKKSFLVLAFILFSFTLGQFLLLNYPLATVEVRPVLEKISKEIQIEAQLLAELAQWDKGIIPLHSFSLVENMEKDFPVRGTNYKGLTKAQGQIIIFNDSDKEVILPKGTLVKTEDGIEFITLEEALVPHRKIETYMKLPVAVKIGQVEVGIEALLAGSSGNVPAGTVSSLTKEKDPHLYVINSLATSGGRDELVRAISDEDFKWAQRMMQESLEAEIIQTAYRQLSGNYLILEETLEIDDCQVTFANKLGDEEIFLKGLGIIKGHGFMVSHKVLDQVLTYQFLKGINEKGSSYDMQVTLNKVVLGEDKVILTFKVEAPLPSPLDTKSLAHALAGSDLDSARGFLARQEGIQSFCILTPQKGNISKLPLGVRIIVQPPL